jgi:deoxycytidylate deaminase
MMSHMHTATITRRGKVIAESRNRVGSRSRGSGWSHQTIHAERAVIKSIGDITRLDGCILQVVRLNQNGEYLDSKPCHACVKFLEKCMKLYGLLKVVYSVQSEKCTSECSH